MMLTISEAARRSTCLPTYLPTYLAEVSVVDHDLERKDGRDSELVALEETTTYVVEHRLGDGIDQDYASVSLYDRHCMIYQGT